MALKNGKNYTLNKKWISFELSFTITHILEAIQQQQVALVTKECLP